MIEFLTSAIITLAMTPLIIRSLGDSMYGLWIFVGSFLGYYGLMDFGLNYTVQRFLSRAIGAKDNADANKIINTSLVLFSFLGIMALALSVVIAFLFPILIKNINNAHVFKLVVLILGTNFAIGFPLRVFSGMLTAHIRYDISTGIDISKIIIRAILIIIVLNQNGGIIALALVVSFSDLGGYIFRYLAVKALYKDIIYSRKLIDFARIKSFFKYSVYVFVTNIADQLKRNIDNLILTALLGLNSVTLYSIGSRLVTYFAVFMANSIGITTPIFSQYDGAGNYDAIRKNYLFFTKICAYMSAIIGGMIIIFGKAFILVWVGEKYLRAYYILMILTIPFIVDIIQIPGNSVLYGISKHHYLSYSTLIEGVVKVVLSIILVKKYGIYGAAIGTAIPIIIMKLLVQPIYTCRILGLKYKQFYIGLFVPAVITCCSILFVYWFSIKSMITPSYFKIFLLVILGLVIIGPLVYLIGFNKDEKSLLTRTVFSGHGKRKYV